MKLKYLAKMQKFVVYATLILMLPIYIVWLILACIQRPFEWLATERVVLMNEFGNWLLRISDEVKDGIIKNERIIKNYTAVFAHENLTEELVNGVNEK